jgi:Asp-tRNA(Asn)/Glu-tRNA(Gln) amidotransferase A subunit family amidase
VAGALPGGSSSGSATAVALGAATIGLATDTAGSVRVPAAYQRLWGLRPTHGAVPVDGVVPLAPDFDTVGLLTRSADLLHRAAGVLLDGGTDPCPATVLRWRDVEPELPALDEWREAFRVHQAIQAWQAHGRWLRDHPGAVAADVAMRFHDASMITSARDDDARAVLRTARDRLDALLDDAVLELPAAAGPPPPIWSTADQRLAQRTTTMRLTCVAGITGRPSVVRPDGMCLVGPRHTDLALIDTAMAWPGS